VRLVVLGEMVLVGGEIGIGGEILVEFRSYAGW